MENERVLTGIELRKAVLEATGWTFGANYSFVANKDWGAYSPNGQIWFAARTLSYAIEGCPAVESSVDAALRWLKLPDGLYWGLETPIDSNAHAYVSILDVDAEMVEDTSGQYMNVPLARANHPSLAVAMCQAYLAWKAGA